MLLAALVTWAHCPYFCLKKAIPNSAFTKWSIITSFLFQEGTRPVDDISLSVLINSINSAADQFSDMFFTNGAKKICDGKGQFSKEEAKIPKDREKERLRE